MLARRTTRGSRRRGFTLVEMMIAMVLTLIMVWAIAEFYARVGEVVKDGRAMIDQRSAMRTATQRMIEDLSLVTVVPAPPAEDETTPIPGNPSQRLSVYGVGYLDIFEGLGSDADPEGNGIDIIPAGGNGIPDIADDLAPANGVPDFIENTLAPSLLGDIDDYIGFTMRSAGEPFVGQIVNVDPTTGRIRPVVAGIPLTDGIGTGASNLAEVAWWTSFNDDPLLATTSPGTWEPAETRSLHRRLLLVRPEVNVVHSGDNDYVDPFTGARLPYYFRISTSDPRGADYHSVMQFCDVSVRPVAVVNNYVYYFANSLADLTRRENRFLHVGVGELARATFFPNPLDLNPNFGGNSLLARNDVGNNFSQFRWILGQLPGNPPPLPSRRGEDVILSNVLAFDVRVFDATAALRYDNAAATVANPGPATGTLQPGDPGYKYAVDNNYAIAGAGAYVDLWYNRYVVPVVPANSSSTFSGPPLAKSQLLAAGPPPGAVYCTWAASYERDGLNQDWAADGLMPPAATAILTGPFDEGTDGLDDDGTGVQANGVDDNGEHETSPPYPTRLRGLEIKIRTYDPGTRQVQQATVGTDFIPE